MSFLLAFLAALLGIGQPGPRSGAEGETGVTIALDPMERGGEAPLPRVTEARGANPPLVVIDPGHGGRDPGARSPGGGELEKDVALALDRAIRSELAASGRVRVALTRDEDRYLMLQERYEIARRLRADLFISVHADAAPLNDGARGATIYTLSEVASDRYAALLAQRQNSADLVDGAQLSPDRGVNQILIDLAQRESMNLSADFARSSPSAPNGTASRRWWC
jgi:N-acetylmuramoyl-L-alanine amidase